MAGAAALGAAAAFAGVPAGAAEAAVVRATAPDGTEFVLESSRGLERVRGRRTVAFGTVVNTPPSPAPYDVGGAARAVRLPLAPRRRTVVGAYLECTPSSGGSFVYGTAGRGVRRVLAVFADGRSRWLRRFRAPRRWGYGGSVFLGIRIARVGLLEVHGYGARGRRVSRAEYWPAPPCRTEGEARPPEPTFRDARPDPDIVTGAVAADLARAERRWRRARIRDYDFELRVICFCPPPAGRWVESHVRDGRPVGRRSTTVRALFRQVRRYIQSRPASLEVEYNRRGVPVEIDYDGNVALADDEATHQVRRFRRR